MITQVEPLAEEYERLIPEHRTVSSRKRACTACRGIPRIVSAGEDGAVTHVPSARLRRSGTEWAGTLTQGGGGGDHLGRSGTGAGSTDSCNRAATLTHKGKQEGDDQM